MVILPKKAKSERSKSMNYRDAIRRSMKKGSYNGFQTFAFLWFLKSIGELQDLLWQQALREPRDKAAIEVTGEEEPVEEDNGEAIQDPTIDDMIKMRRSVLPIGLTTGWKIDEFTGWLMEQNAPDKKIGDMWYELPVLVNKYNEWIDNRGGRA